MLSREWWSRVAAYFQDQEEDGARRRNRIARRKSFQTTVPDESAPAEQNCPWFGGRPRGEPQGLVRPREEGSNREDQEVPSPKRPRWRVGVLDGRRPAPPAAVSNETEVVDLTPNENCPAPQLPVPPRVLGRESNQSLPRLSSGTPPAGWRLRCSESSNIFDDDDDDRPLRKPRRPLVRKSLKARAALPARQSLRLAEIRQGVRRNSAERRRGQAESWRASEAVLKTVKSRRRAGFLKRRSSSRGPREQPPAGSRSSFCQLVEEDDAGEVNSHTAVQPLRPAKDEQVQVVVSPLRIPKMNLEVSSRRRASVLGNGHLAGWSARVVLFLGRSPALAKPLACTSSRVAIALLQDVQQVCAELRPELRACASAALWSEREDWSFRCASGIATTLSALQPVRRLPQFKAMSPSRDQATKVLRPSELHEEASFELEQARVSRMCLLLKGLATRVAGIAGFEE